MGLFLPDAVPWKAGPTSLRPGTRMAILEGDPSRDGMFTVGMRHFAWAEGETVLQLHGRGPWTVTYVNPADDPRKHGQ
jgi:hypothetical protein